MITKERLKELIEQNATIYEVKYHNINPVYIDKKIKIYEKYEMIEIPFNYSEKYRRRKYFKNLYETKEEAEWQLEFGNITRTEKLELLTWEEFCKSKKGINFNAKNGIKYLLIKKYQILLFCEISGRFPKKEWQATNGNYIEACKICKKLFLGEDYGN